MILFSIYDVTQYHDVRPGSVFIARKMSRDANKLWPILFNDEDEIMLVKDTMSMLMVLDVTHKLNDITKNRVFIVTKSKGVFVAFTYTRPSIDDFDVV